MSSWHGIIVVIFVGYELTDSSLGLFDWMSALCL
jgi:hypothetical protein